MSLPVESAQPFTFVLSVPEPSTHLVEIEMLVPPFSKGVGAFELVMPVWAPGSYSVRDFSRNLRDLAVSSETGEALQAEKIEKNRWRVTVPKNRRRGGFRVRYRVYANELNVRSSHVDSSHAYGNGTSLFLYVEGRKAEPQRLAFRLPDGWRPTIALPEKEGFFFAVDYDELVDSPFECGTHRVREFTAGGKPHVLAIWGRGNEDEDRLVRDLTKIVETTSSIFGGLPYDRYVFLVHIAAGAGGGLEHRNSQSVGISPWHFQPEKEYRDVLALFAHEFFHTWIVKRVRPESLARIDYTKEVYTKDLWAMEGITSYYEWLLIVRAGLVEPKHAFEDWAKTIKAHRETPGTAVQSAEASSFDTWIRLYRPDENSPNVSESYYRRGALIGLALDLSIRQSSGGRFSLDDVLRRLMALYGNSEEGYPEGAFEKVIVEATGFPARRFFEEYVEGTNTPPFETLILPAGLSLVEKPEKDGDEDESKDPRNLRDPEVKEKPDFRWKTKTEEGRLTVTEVYTAGAAQRAGINAKDEIVAIDGFKADEALLKRVENDLKPGDTVKLHVFRRSQLMEIPVVLGARRFSRYDLGPVENPEPSQEGFFSSWLGRPFPKKDQASSPSP